MNKSVAYFQSIIIFLILVLILYYVTFQCGRKNIFRKILRIYFAHKKLKKAPQKVAYLWQFFFSAALTAQNGLELHFRFEKSFIQPSRVGSLAWTDFKTGKSSPPSRFDHWKVA